MVGVIILAVVVVLGFLSLWHLMRVSDRFYRRMEEFEASAKKTNHLKDLIQLRSDVEVFAHDEYGGIRQFADEARRVIAYINGKIQGLSAHQ